MTAVPTPTGAASLVPVRVGAGMLERLGLVWLDMGMQYLTKEMGLVPMP